MQLLPWQAEKRLNASKQVFHSCWWLEGSVLNDTARSGLVLYQGTYLAVYMEKFSLVSRKILTSTRALPLGADNFRTSCVK